MSIPNQPGLGRLFAPDHRDYRLRASGLVAPETRPARTKDWPLMSGWLDQGQTGTCVGHAWRHLLIGTPRPYKNPLPTAFDIYDAAILVDEWPDNDQDTARQMGTSIRAGAKVLQGKGLIASYAWADSLDVAIDWLTWHGPLVGGFNWYSSMFNRDQDRFLRIDANAGLVGGHAIYIFGWDNKRGAARCYTSWREFGIFLFSGETLERLIRENGELCTPVERAPAAA